MFDHSSRSSSSIAVSITSFERSVSPVKLHCCGAYPTLPEKKYVEEKATASITLRQPLPCMPSLRRKAFPAIQPRLRKTYAVPTGRTDDNTQNMRSFTR